MLRKVNAKISLAALGAASLIPTSMFAALADGDTCGTKQVYLNKCEADCIDDKVVKTGGDPNCIITYGSDTITATDVIAKVTNWLTTLVGIIAVLFLIYGGLVYITSAGNKERAESAKKIITYSVIGLVIVVLARVVVSLVVNTAGEAI